MATDEIDRYVSRHELVSVDPVDTLRKARTTGVISFTAGAETFEIALVPNDLRAPGYRAQVTHEDGSTSVLPSAEVNTYAGRVLNREGAVVRFTIDEHGMQGLIIDGDEKYFVEPMLNYSLSAGPTDYVFYNAADVRPDASPGTCAATAAEQMDEVLDSVSAKLPESEQSVTAAAYVADVATEADNEYVAALGSAAAANSEILTIVNQVDGVYQNEVGIHLQVTVQNTYAGADPYSTTLDPNTLLNEFRSYWNGNMGSVVRDAAHMFTGKDMTGSTIGIAWVGVVCRSPSYAYGVSQRYTSSPQKYVLTAHELGHNFNGCHSDSSCNPSTGSCSNTIMQSFVGTGFTFCQFSRDQISAFAAANSGCLAAGTTPSPTAPAAPSSLGASAVSASQVNLSWVDNSSNETGFKIERKTGSTGTWAQIATTGAGATSYSNTGLASGTTYYYRVRATNGTGDSSYTNEAAATTTTTTTTVPAAPSSLSASAVSSSQINLAWTDNSSDESGFRVERSTDGASWSQIASVGAGATSYSNTGLRKNRTYYYRVRAYNAGGNSGYSNTASARTPR